jgi:hypothetical protein
MYDGAAERIEAVSGSRGAVRGEYGGGNESMMFIGISGSSSCDKAGVILSFSADWGKRREIWLKRD